MMYETYNIQSSIELYYEGCLYVLVHNIFQSLSTLGCFDEALFVQVNIVSSVYLSLRGFYNHQICVYLGVRFSVLRRLRSRIFLWAHNFLKWKLL